MGRVGHYMCASYRSEHPMTVFLFRLKSSSSFWVPKMRINVTGSESQIVLGKNFYLFYSIVLSPLYIQFKTRMPRL